MRKVFSLLAVLLVSTAMSFAQAGFGTLTGVVTDQSGAVVPNATVSLSGPNGISRTAATNSAGEYSFTAVPVAPGYTLSVNASGFSSVKAINIATSVGTTLTNNFSLKPGGSNETITISTASVEQVQTQTSAVSQLIDNTIWRDSPLESRTQNAFVALVAGATPDNANTGDTGRGAAISGARTGTGNFLVEGMDNNDQGQGGAGFTYGGGGAVTTISPDAIEEYRVFTHNPPAQYGRAGGFSTDTSLKSGSNRFHGSLFEYNRIQALAANDWFSNYSGVKDSLIRNQFGGSVGGPIDRDKTFFYASVELHRLRTGVPVTGTVTTQQFLDFVDSGQFETFQESNQNGLCVVTTGSTCSGAFSGAAHLGSTFKSLLANEPSSFPLGTQNASTTAQGLYTGGSATGSNAVIYPVPVYAQVTKIQSQPTNQERGSLKIDHKLTNSDQLSFDYLADFENAGVTFGGGGTTFGPDESQVGGSQLFTGNWIHTFSPSLQNLFRIGYLRHVSNFTASGNITGVPEIVSYADPLASGFGASAGLPQTFTDTEFLYEDQLTKELGRHSLNTGFRFVRTRNGSKFYNDNNGTLYPWDVESLVTDETFDDQADRAILGASSYGSLAYASASIDSTTDSAPDPYRAYRANEFAAYVQDDWKITPKLVLNLGVRWEYFGPPHNAQPGFDSNVYFGTFGAPTPNGNPFLPNASIVGAIQGATFIQKNSNIWNKDTNNFAPRIGFSFDPKGDGKTVFRGGFGVGYDRLYNNVYENIRFNPPHFADNSIGLEANGVIAGALEQPDLINVPFTANSLFASYGGKPVPRHIDQRLVTAYYEQAMLGFEQQLANGYVFELDYIGTFGRKLVGLEDVNNFPGRTACPTLTAACLAAGFTSVSTARPNTLFNTDNFRTNGFSSNYNGLQASLRKAFANGLMFLVNYTYSKSMDNTSDVFKVKGNQTGISVPLDPSYDYGPADFDMRHLFKATLNYETQLRKRNILLGGWGFSPIFTWSSGAPFSVYDSEGGYDPQGDSRTGAMNRTPYIGLGKVGNAITHHTNPAQGYLVQSDFAGYGNNAAYSCPTTAHNGLWCLPPVQRNSIYGPGNINLDMGISKRFFVTEVQRITFQASYFNVFNHANFTNPVADVNSSSFGLSQSDAGPRVGQLSLRYDF